MNTATLAAVVGVYLAGMLALRRTRWSLIGYLWMAFGLAAILILSGQAGRWDELLGSLQGHILLAASNAVGFRLAMLPPASLVVPDPSGWSILQLGVECSTLIEVSVFAGLILFYPRFPPGERLARFTAGLAGTIVVNMLRLVVIVALVASLGKPAVLVAHAIVGRLVFFVGIVILYWQMLTVPTLRIVRRDLEVSGRSAL